LNQAGFAKEVYQKLEDLLASSADDKARLLLLRQILESIYKDKCKDSHTSFSSLFGRMQYVHEQTALPSELVYQANQLRIICNKVAHEEYNENLREAFEAGIAAVVLLVVFYYNQTANGELSKHLDIMAPKGFPRQAHSEKESFIAIVRSFTKADQGIEICAVNELSEHCTIFLRDDLSARSEGRLWSKLVDVLWKNATVRFRKLTVSNKDQGRFTSNPLTMVILEPDFLIDASAISECIMENNKSHPQFYIINRLFSDQANENMMQGNMVNQIFDRMVFEPMSSIDEMIEWIIPQSPMQMVGLGDGAVSQIKSSIKERHYPQLKVFVDRLQAQEMHLEPSFICPDYGLQGRLDLLYKKDGKFSIVELKSGKAPHFDAWHSHKMQVVAYNMIIRKVFSHKELANSSILYSSDPEQPLRNVVNAIQIEQELMFCRNRIVGILHQLAENPKPFFDWLKGCPKLELNNVLREKHNRICDYLNRLSDDEYEWFMEQIRHIILEIWNVKLGSNASDLSSRWGHNALWQQDVYSKQEAYRIIRDLGIVSVHGDAICLQGNSDMLVSDFREGDIILLYKQDLPVEKQQLFRGTISYIEGSRVEISIRGGLILDESVKDLHQWTIEHDILDSLLYTPLASVTSFLNANTIQKHRILGITDPGGITGAVSNDLDNLLDRINQAETYFVIQGPPGTGKTSGLLTRYVDKLYKDSSRRLLIISFTNRAVDEICLCLNRAGIPFIRTGKSSAVPDQLLSSLAEGKTIAEIEDMIRNTRVFISTVQSANSWFKDTRSIISFDELIIDEASQIIEPSVLGIISEIPKLILIGDQNQLPPITAQGYDQYVFTGKQLSNLRYSTYQRSLMERLYLLCESNGWYQSIGMLSCHFRMHETIAALIGHYYDGKLQASNPRQRAPLPENKSGLTILDKRIAWISFPPTDTQRYDIKQVIAVKKLIKIFIEQGEIIDYNTDIGVIAPFRAMIHCLAKELDIPELIIDTVERFQGSQRKIIILCLPLRSSADIGAIESLNEDGSIDRKLNVAISRACERLIILGSPRICQASPHYKRLLEGIKTNGIITDNEILRSLQ